MDSVGVGVGVGLCARTGVAAIITANASAIPIAAAIRRTRSSPIVCRVPESCAAQRMDCALQCRVARACSCGVYLAINMTLAAPSKPAYTSKNL